MSVVRRVCRERLKFEVEYGMQRGSTDNSYIVKGDDAAALLDLPDKSFAQAFAASVDCGAPRLHRPRPPPPSASTLSPRS